ncbi:MAG: hypothetical protein K1X64_14405 [Myxococcaceae bacterium]|nr:hypothetical protein [Myxococcaceae bacterium]
MDPFERICRYLYGELPIEALRSALAEAPRLEEALGKTAYRDLLAFDPCAGGETGFRERSLELFEERLPGRLLSIRARHVCEQMVNGSKDLVPGIKEMSALRDEPGGDTIVPAVFDGLASETPTLVDARQEANWDPSALAVYRAAAARQLPALLSAARAAAQAFLAQNP